MILSMHAILIILILIFLLIKFQHSFSIKQKLLLKNDVGLRTNCMLNQLFQKFLRHKSTKSIFIIAC